LNYIPANFAIEVVGSFLSYGEEVLAFFSKKSQNAQKIIKNNADKQKEI